MISVNTKIADAAVGHQVDLLRVEAGLQRDVLALMRDLSGDLAATLAKAGEWDGESIPLKLKRLQGLKSQTDGLIGDLYAKLESDTTAEMKDAAQFAAQWAPQAINAAVGVDIAAITLTPQLLNNLVKNTLVEGAPSSQWWSRQSDALKMDFSREMRMGILQGENLGDLTRRIRGRKENGYADGLLPPSADAAGKISRLASTKATRAAEGLALTSVQQVMSDARMEAYRQNSDIIKGVQQLSTLDGRTSATCRGLDHAARALDGSPLPGLALLPSGGPPWHWRCRSVLIPITKSWAELGIKGQKEIPPGTRSSMDGQVPETMDYETWLKSKPEAFQKEVLGKGRFELWQSGKADLKDMVDQRGRPVKVRELNSTADGAMVAGMKPDAAKPNAKPVPGQLKWKDLDPPRVDIRKVDPSLKLEDPGMLPPAGSVDEAVKVVAQAIGVSKESPIKQITTPIEEVRAEYDKILHLVEKRGDDRERYAKYILPTLRSPFEIWKVAYDDGGDRHRYIGLFQGERDLAIAVKVDPDGSLLWNIMQDDHAGMNRMRLGELVYEKKQASTVKSE